MFAHHTSVRVRIALLALLTGTALVACGQGASNLETHSGDPGPAGDTQAAADETAGQTPATNSKPGHAPPTPAPATDEELFAFLSGLPGEALPEGAEVHKTDSGLIYAVLEPGEPGQACLSNDKVNVYYTGYFESGKVFDQKTRKTGPANFSVGGVIAGWTEALQLMTTGARLKIYVPSDLAYGERGFPGSIPARSNLVFDMDLLSVVRGVPPVPVPDFVLPGDEQLTTTASGLQYMVVEQGSGPSPLSTDKVTVHYAGWLTNGKGFDNSYQRGEPSSFGLRQVIAGWTEGLALMSVGATYIFVIPYELAYGAGGRPPTIPPKSTLVFRVELLSILDPRETYPTSR